jgi:hypothetical protein
MQDTPEQQGLLPIYSHEKRLENESLDELRPVLRGFFLIRDERAQDYGVDVSLEVIIGDRATNYRSMVQVKARSDLQPNKDGSLSLKVESSNVEYLLNAASATIILYDADRKALYWCDALDEVLALKAAGTEYRDQGSVVIRLVKRLTRDTVGEFQAQILADLRAARRLRFQVGGLAADALVHVNADGVGATSDDVERDFLTAGWRLAARGYVDEVARMFGLAS